MTPLTATIFSTLGTPVDYALEHLVTVLHRWGTIQAVGAFGVAIILVTLVIRTALFPIFGWQLRTSRKVQAEQRLIAPQLAELRKRYKGEPQRLTEEMNKLYREHGISPFSGLAGCLPALVQAPVVVALYNGIQTATSHLHADKRFLWINDVSTSGLHASGPHAGWASLIDHPAVLILPVLAATATFVQSKMTMPPVRSDMSEQERQMQGVSKTLTTILPFSVLFFGVSFPQGVAIYWVTQSLYMILQQYYVVGWGGMPVPAWLPGAHRVTALSLPRHPSPLVNARSTTPRSAGANVKQQQQQQRPKGSGGPTGRPGSAGRRGSGGRKRRR